MRLGSWPALLAACFLHSVGHAGPLPAQIARARYVALGYDTGERFLSEVEAMNRPDRVLPEDRAGLANLRDQLESWGQYVVTTRPEDAEILFAVRTGRRAAVGAGVHVGGASGGLHSGGPMFRAEVSSPDDMLTIYESSRGQVGALLWRQRQEAGRGYPGRLFTQLKQEVEAAPRPEPAPRKP